MHINVCVCGCECKSPRRPFKNIGSPGAGVTGSVNCLMWAPGAKLRSSTRVVLALSCIMVSLDVQTIKCPYMKQSFEFRLFSEVELIAVFHQVVYEIPACRPRRCCKDSY